MERIGNRVTSSLAAEVREPSRPALLMQDSSQSEAIQLKTSQGDNPDNASLTILFDGGCPLCVKEVNFLRRKDRDQHRLGFVDIDADDYAPKMHGGISYRDAMGRIHAITANGDVLRDVEVFRRAYQLIGLGWLYAPTRWPLLRPLADGAYRLWAATRLGVTGRPELDVLCQQREAAEPCEAGGRCRT